MIDQATQLRSLVLRAVRETAQQSGQPPRMWAISGGRSGVGVTTLAVNLAVAVSGQGARTVLVDADPFRADIAEHCGLQPRGSVSEILNAHRDIHEILEPGPAGVQIAAGSEAWSGTADFAESALRRLLRHLTGLGRHAELVVLDTGNGGHDVMRRFWQTVDEILLVTTPEPLAVMDCYATIKRLSASRDDLAIQVIINQAPGPESATDAYQRIRASCERFLGLRVAMLGYVPEDPQLTNGHHEQMPLILAQPASPAAVAIERMASRLFSEPPTRSENQRTVDATASNEKLVRIAQSQAANAPIHT